MLLLNLLYRDIPAPVLSEAVCYIYDRISGTVCCGYLCLPVLKAHSKAALVDMSEALLLQSLFIDYAGTLLNIVHQL